MARYEIQICPKGVAVRSAMLVTSILHERLKILSRFKHVLETGEAKQPYHHHTTHPSTHSTHSDDVYDPEDSPKNLTNLFLNPPLPVP